MRSAELTLPGFVHDVCSAVQPFAPISPAFRRCRSRRHGLDWIEPPAMFAHPFDDGVRAAVVQRASTRRRGLSASTRDAYRNLIGPVVAALGAARAVQCWVRRAGRGIPCGWRGSGCVRSGRRAASRRARFADPSTRALCRRAGRARDAAARAR